MTRAHPSGMPLLARVLVERGLFPLRRGEFEPVADEVLADLADAVFGSTPARIFLRRTCEAAFAATARRLEELGRRPAPVVAAYSVKTNPAPELLRMAREHGLLAETITQLEAASAIARGFTPSQIVLNGPAKLWPEQLVTSPVRAAFADSIGELQRLLDDPVADVVGFRVRPHAVPSRFGIPVSIQLGALRSVLARVPRSKRLGMHFHVSPTALGPRRWRWLADTFLQLAETIRDCSPAHLSVLDFGGGWYPGDWERALDEVVPYLQDGAAALGVDELVLEPGKALAQDSHALVTRILDVRAAPLSEIVVDASIAEVPDLASHPHRVLAQTGGRWTATTPGEWRILGRSCMEQDVLSAGISLPGALRAGDLLVVLDAGAYDCSMEYRFGRGPA